MLRNVLLQREVTWALSTLTYGVRHKSTLPRAMILHQVVGLPSEDAMAEHAGAHAPIEVFRTVLALMPAPARAMFDAALERHERRVEGPQDNPTSSQDDFERMVAGIAAGDGTALTQFADYLSELGLPGLSHVLGVSTLRGAASQIAAAETTQPPMIRRKASR